MAVRSTFAAARRFALSTSPPPEAGSISGWTVETPVVI